jgi:7-carboxy-7-deazaguanine synthase
VTDPRWPVIEVFGPTVQGEGPEAGRPCHFIRFGGCDFRCSWCDSMYAVEPSEVRANAQSLGVTGIVNLLNGLEGNPEWVVLSGGNPALLDLAPLVHTLKAVCGYKVAVETQGSRWKPWLADVDRLVVSPKPPSSGMATGAHLAALSKFMGEAIAAGIEPAVKIVVADDTDFTWARMIFETFPTEERHLSACTPQRGEGGWEANYPMDESGNLILAVSERYAWLAEKVAADPSLAGVRVLPQLHVIAWGNARGV